MSAQITPLNGKPQVQTKLNQVAQSSNHLKNRIEVQSIISQSLDSSLDSSSSVLQNRASLLDGQSATPKNTINLEEGPFSRGSSPVTDEASSCTLSLSASRMKANQSRTDTPNCSSITPSEVMFCTANQ